MTVTGKIYSKYKDIKAYFKSKWDDLSILDRYILKQLIDVFVLGVIVFTSIIFASETFKHANLSEKN